jgi:hypothetical protein
LKYFESEKAKTAAPKHETQSKKKVSESDVDPEVLTKTRKAIEEIKSKITHLSSEYALKFPQRMP